MVSKSDEMGIIIEEINPTNAKDVNQCDGEFIIDAKMVLSLEDDEIKYQIMEIPKAKKRYAIEGIDLAAYIDNPNKTIFLAYFDNQVAGQIILSKKWNNFADVEDILVDVKLRRKGIGRELMLQAIQWAQEHNLAGVMLETQNNNVKACKFYEKCGFQLGGIDKYLYKGLHQETNEIALYWYLFF